jgi:hypothetical protein
VDYLDIESEVVQELEAETFLCPYTLTLLHQWSGNKVMDGPVNVSGHRNGNCIISNPIPQLTKFHSISLRMRH